MLYPDFMVDMVRVVRPLAFFVGNIYGTILPWTFTSMRPGAE